MWLTHSPVVNTPPLCVFNTDFLRAVCLGQEQWWTATRERAAPAGAGPWKAGVWGHVPYTLHPCPRELLPEPWHPAIGSMQSDSAPMYLVFITARKSKICPHQNVHFPLCLEKNKLRSFHGNEGFIPQLHRCLNCSAFVWRNGKKLCGVDSKADMPINTLHA